VIYGAPDSTSHRYFCTNPFSYSYDTNASSAKVNKTRLDFICIKTEGDESLQQPEFRLRFDPLNKGVKNIRNCIKHLFGQKKKVWGTIFNRQRRYFFKKKICQPNWLLYKNNGDKF